MHGPVKLPRRVLLVADAVGGVWSYATELCRHYTRHGIDVTLVGVGPPPSAARQEAVAAISRTELILVDLPLDWTARDEPALRETSDALGAFVASIDADVVHLNSPGLACSKAWDFPLVSTFHSCVATWWQAVRAPAPLPADFVWRRQCMKEGLDRSHAVLVPSHALAVEAERLYGCACSVVHNGVGPTARPRGTGEISAFAAGRLWDEAKNMSLLDRAADGLDVPVYAAGATQGPNGAAIELPNLHLLGEIEADAMAARLAATTVFVAPSIYEPFGLGVLEAAHAGCALLLADIPTFRELWDGAAWFFDPTDAAGLRRMISSLCRDRPACEALGAAASARARRFTGKTMAAATLDAYARVLDAICRATAVSAVPSPAAR